MPSGCCMQVPYDVSVTGPYYTSLIGTVNANAVGNVTNGTMDLRVTQPYQSLDPSFGNMVNMTLTLASSSQASACCHRVLF